MNDWIIAKPEPATIDHITRSLAISPLLAQLLINRNIATVETAKGFLYPELGMLHNPFLFPQMEVAVDRIKQALKQKERILVYGDYDADGLTGTALLYEILRKYTDQVDHYIPHRINEGYGLNPDAVQQAKQNGINLIITVDCGITAITEAELAGKYGIDLIITDHHTPPEDGSLPQAIAILHSGLPNSTYPFQYLAGVGVAFKFAQAISATMEKQKSAQLELLDYLDLVVIGTICDVVPLIGENRILSKFGLQSLSKTMRPGLQALMAIAGIGNKKMDNSHVAFMLGPRLNAAGRIGQVETALQLLLTQSSNEAEYLAKQLDAFNKERQQIELDILSEAEEEIQSTCDLVRNQAIVLANEFWHQGVLGIVAGKLAEKYHRPVVLFALNQDEWSGSARGIGKNSGEFDLMQALSRCQDLLLNYGGHWKAAGITIGRNRFTEFQKQFCVIVTAMLAETPILPSLFIDAEIAIPQLTHSFLKEELSRLEPYGADNPEPTFIARNLTLNDQPRLLKEKHLKLLFTAPEKVKITAMGYNWVNKYSEFPTYGETYEVVFYPKLNYYQGLETMEIQIKDIRKTNRSPEY
jgi:single-stranded-DNA-specific exonuclease